MKLHQAQDLCLGVGILLLALLALLVIIPAGVDPPANIKIRALAPGFWPNIVMLFMAFMGLIIAVQGFLDYRSASATEQPRPADQLAPAIATLRVVTAIVMPTFIFIIWLNAYYWLLELLGFVAASMIAILAFTLLSGERRWRYVIPVSLVLPVLLYYFFTHVANVFIPLGLFEDW